MSSPLPRSNLLPADSSAPTSYSWLRETRPPSISDVFAVVPPMSNVITFSNPSACASPSDGDDARRGSPTQARRPADRRVGGGHDAARRLHDLERRRPGDVGDAGADVVEVAGHQRPDVRVHGGRGGALVLLLLAQDSNESETGTSGNSARSTSPSSRSCSG